MQQFSLSRFMYRAMHRIYEYVKGVRCILLTVVCGNVTKHTGYLAGKKVFIIGNGSSRNDVDLRQFVGKVEGFCCVNDFPIEDEMFWELKPKWFCIFDPEYFETDIAEQKRRNEELVKCLHKVDWPMLIITKEGAGFGYINENVSYAFLSRRTFVEIKLSKFGNYVYNKNFGIWAISNVVSTAAFYFVANMANMIYLSGVDYSNIWGLCVDSNNHVIQHDRHFYGEKEIDFTDMGYVQEGEFGYLLEAFVSGFYEMMRLREYADMNGSKVINLSMRSYIDCFPKMDWKDALITLNEFAQEITKG